LKGMLLPTAKVIVVSSMARAVWINPPPTSISYWLSRIPSIPSQGESTDWWRAFLYGVMEDLLRRWRGLVVVRSSLLHVTFCKMIPVELTWLVTKETHSVE
jgi:hypothetical protein